MNFFTRLSNGWNICLNSLLVLKKNKRLVLLPLLAGASLVVILGSFVVVWLSIAGWDPARIGESGSFARYGMIFSFYLVNYFVLVFFNTALVYCTRSYFRGERVSVSAGLRFSAGRIGVLFAWAVFSATVGALLKVIQQNVGVFGKILAGITGMIWGIATFFVVPILAFEETGPLEAFRRSSRLMKQKWGESLAATFHFALIQWLAIFLVETPFLIIGLFIDVYLGWILAAVCVFFVMSIMSAAQTIFISAVFQEVRGEPVKDFSPALSENLFLRK